MHPIAYPELPYNAVICRYNEIATKGKNRGDFENLLVNSLRRCLADLGPLRIMRERGRIFIRRKQRDESFSHADCRLLRTRAAQVMGLASMSPGFMIATDRDEITAVVNATFPDVYRAVAAAIAEPATIGYAMRSRRNDKSFPVSSKELEIGFAERIMAAFPRLRLDLRRPDLCIHVEIRRERTLVYYETIPGPGGLPTGSAGRVLALLSGGIDSPVACYQIMKRGCTVDFVTFHSAPYTPATLITKVAALARILNRYQKPGKLCAVNLLPAQKAIRDTCKPRFRTVLYRRMIMRVSAELARYLRAKALVTGDNIGQVASQTLENLGVIARATDALILRPLLTAEKQDTTELAKTIDTFAISIEDIFDSCTVFAPADPTTAATVRKVEDEEAGLDIPALVRECLAATTFVNLETGEQYPPPRLAGDACTSLTESAERLP